MEQQELLFFDIGDVKCALPIRCSERVIAAAELTIYPEMPPDLEGIINISGELLPVMNLRTLLIQPQKSLMPEHFFVIFNSANGRAAIRAESLPRPGNAEVDQNIVFDKLGNRPEQLANLLGQDDGTVVVLDPKGLYPQSTLDFISGIIESKHD